jgi:hypothetical protein
MVSQSIQDPVVVSAVHSLTNHELYQNIQRISQRLLAESCLAVQTEHQFRYLQLHYELKRRHQKQTVTRRQSGAKSISYPSWCNKK